MKEKSLFTLLLLCMIGSALVLFFALQGIDSIRARSANIGPGGFNSLMQLDRALDVYSDSLERYVRAGFDSELKSDLAAEYRKDFDIVWGNLDHFKLRFLQDDKTETLFDIFNHDGKQFLTEFEPYMDSQNDLSTEEALLVLKELGQLQSQVHELGLEYFYNSLSFRDAWTNRLNNFHSLLLWFSAAFAVAACSLVAFLIRSNNRKNLLMRKAEEAQSELSKTVAELRSGQREQKAKDSFIATASHDLRQPLHALGLFLGSLEGHIHTDKGRNTLKDAVQCSDNLGSLFNSMLDLSRLDAGIVSVEKNHFRLIPLLQELEQEFLVKANEKSIEIKLDLTDCTVYSDSILLSRVIRNIVENALLHSGADTITISCSMKGTRHQIEIEDNGHGIAKMEQEKIFNEYYQINSKADGNTKGLGLGLSIVKRLSDLMEMDIAMQSDSQSYTRFTMDIESGDVDKIINPTVEVLSHSNTPAEHVVVAIIDDDKKICTAMGSMLSNFDIDVVTAMSANEMIDNIVESNKYPNLVVADYQLQKGQTGDQAILQLKRALNLDIPALIVTGDTSPAQVAAANESGYDVLHKPVQPALLLSKIASLVAAEK